ncbi:MAG: FAD-dependent oxidoreductase [Rhodanobacteraceae bacterium]
MLDHVFTPIRVGALALRHRIMMGSMHLNLETVGDGSEWAAFYVERIRGGADLVVTGGIAVNRAGAGSSGYAVLTDVADRERLARAADAVHAAAGHIALQLFHAGRYAFPDAFGITPLAPSAVYSPFSRCTAAAMTDDDVASTITDFAAGARAAIELGFDAVEVMGSEGYLINQFASPLTNRRDDEWGGSAEARRRFPVAVLAAVRRAVGPDFPVIARTSGNDVMDGSSSATEHDALAAALVAAGADAVNVGIGWHESRTPTVQSLVPHGTWIETAARIRRALRDSGSNVPVIGSNRVNSLAQAEAFLAAGDVDMVSMARPFLADPGILAKSRSGRSAFVNTCIGCNQACIDRSFGSERVSCLVNPRAGNELEFPTPAPPPARPHPAPRVAVIGAGPAGMQAAATLAGHGIEVDLFETEPEIGGQFRLARRVPGKADYGETIRYFAHELDRLGVRLRTSTTADAAMLGSYAHVIVASGVVPRRVSIPGADLPHVMSYRQAFADVDAVGSRVAVMGAGGIGVDLAEFLVNPDGGGLDDAAARRRFAEDHGLPPYRDAKRRAPRRQVTIMRRSGRIGAGIGPSTRWAVVASIRGAGVATLTGVEYRRITREGIWIIPPDDTAGQRAERLIPADTVIIAAGQVPNTELAEGLQRAGIPCTAIGGALDAAGLTAVRAFEQGLRAATLTATAIVQHG